MASVSDGIILHMDVNISAFVTQKSYDKTY